MAGKKGSSNGPALSKTSLAIACGAGVALLAVSAVALTAYQQSQTQANLALMTEQLGAVAAQLEASSGQGQRQCSDDLVSAIDRVMEQRASAEREAARAEIMSNYTDLPTEVEDYKWTYGETDARFTLYTYSDPNCPYCQDFHDTPKQLVDSSQGTLNAQYHHMTILSANSTTQALASECAGRLGDNQHFWAVNDAIYAEPQMQRSGLLDIAETLGFDRTEFSQCMSSSAVRGHVAALAEDARAKGVTGTPTSILTDNESGNSVRITGAQPPGAIIAALREMLTEDQARATAQQ